MHEKDLCCGCDSEQRKIFGTALRMPCQFMMSPLQGTLQNDLLYRLSNKLGQKWPLVRLYEVLHPVHYILTFLFAYVSDDVVSVLGITKPKLPTASIFILDDDGIVLSEGEHVEMAEDDVRVQFQWKLVELEQQGGPVFYIRKAPENRSTCKTL